MVTVASLHSVVEEVDSLVGQDLHAVSAFESLGFSVDRVMMDESEFVSDLAEARNMLGLSC